MFNIQYSAKILATLLLSFRFTTSSAQGGNFLDENWADYFDKPWSELESAISENSVQSIMNFNSQKIVCPGGNQTCADSYTCCLNPSGSYSCCPEHNGVCCSDHIHCCPSDSVCDTKGGRCTKKVNKLSLNNNICPGGEYQCPDHSTCCSLIDGQYGCCPLENAVCCSDHLHCCPDGYTCDAGGYCRKNSFP